MTSVKVRIAVAVEQSGCWNASGGSLVSDDESVEFVLEATDPSPPPRVYWVTAELSIPEPVEVEGTVEE